MAAINQFGGAITCITPNSPENGWNFTFLVLRLSRRVEHREELQKENLRWCLAAHCSPKRNALMKSQEFSPLCQTHSVPWVSQLHSETRTLVTFAFVQGSMRTINLYLQLNFSFLIFFFFLQIIDSKWRNYSMEEWKTLNRAGISRSRWLGLGFQFVGCEDGLMTLDDWKLN